MKSISIFIVLFILLSAGTCLLATPHEYYYCSCQPSQGRICQCNASNGHPLTNIRGEPIGNIAINKKLLLNVICMGANAVVPRNGEPAILTPNRYVHCNWEGGFGAQTAFAYCFNGTLSVQYIKISQFNCASRG